MTYCEVIVVTPTNYSPDRGSLLPFLNSESREECIDFTIIVFFPANNFIGSRIVPIITLYDISKDR